MFRNTIGLTLVIGALIGTTAYANTLQECQDACWAEFNKGTHDCGEKYFVTKRNSEKLQKCIDEKLEAFKVCIKECK